MNQVPGHLSDDEIRDCANASPRVGSQPIEGHLSECEGCLHRLLQWQRTQLKHLETDGMREQPYPDCPNEETLRDTAAETALPHVANGVLQHAAQCDHCGPLLNSYFQAFSEELSPEIEALIQQLPGSSPKYQREKAREIAGQMPAPRTSGSRVPIPGLFGWWKAMAFSIATASVVLVAILEGPEMYTRWQILQASHLVTVASSMIGTTEMRIPGQTSKPEHTVVKGPNDGYDWSSKPAELSEAEIIVNKHCPPHPDVNCLEIKGQISRLERQVNSAKDAAAYFAKALESRPGDPRLKIELAISYFDLSKAEKDPSLKAPLESRIQELLLTALKDPKLQEEDKKVATFDLALAYEMSELWPEAIGKWEEYLALDSSGPWRAEAQERLEKAKKKLPVEKPVGYFTPGYLLQHSRERGVAHDSEQYFDIAMREWLSDAARNPYGEAAQALRKLGDLLVEQHSDPWLKQFMAASGRTSLAEVEQVSAAINDNIDDLHIRALKESREAARAFRRQKNFPGLAMAYFQEVYALQRMLQGGKCLAQAKALGSLLANSNFGWLRTQVESEKFVCAGMIDDKSAKQSLETSRKTSQEFHYPGLALRIAGLEASSEMNHRHYDAAWSKAVTGLHTYWEGSYSWERIYQLYATMWACANHAAAPHAAHVLMLQGIRIIERGASRDTVLQAVLYLGLANNLREMKEEAVLAEETNAKAMDLFKKSGDETANYFLWTQIKVAQIELDRNSTEKALSVLKPVRELLATGNIPIKVDFYGTLAKAYWKSGKLDSAVAAYRSGLEAAEKSIPNTPREEQMVSPNDIYGGLAEVLLIQGRKEESLNVWERFKMLKFASRNSTKIDALNLSNADFSQFQTPHLIYASFEDHLQIWILSKGEVRVRSVAVGPAELQQSARELVDGCKSPNTNQELVDESERKLYSYLVGPVLNDLPAGEAVAIELGNEGDELSRIKIELLKDPQNHYFSDDYTIVYSPGLLVEKDLRAPLLLEKQDRVLLVNGSGNLPGNDMERESVTSNYPHTLIMDGDGVTKADIRKASRDRAAFIYSGHTREDGDNLVLAVNPSTWMKAEDFVPGSLSKMRLVILSACASGVSQNGLENSHNFVHAFLLAGVPNIVASGWDVDSKTTAQFMQKFYESLGQGESAAHALDHARKAMRSVKPNPYYWAAFSLTGRIA
jgi:CHAT domain-containing protein